MLRRLHEETLLLDQSGRVDAFGWKPAEVTFRAETHCDASGIFFRECTKIFGADLLQCGAGVLPCLDPKLSSFFRRGWRLHTHYMSANRSRVE